MVPPIPEKQKALWLPKAQGKFQVGEADVPQPGPGEVLVREEAVGLNPIDYVTQTTGMFATEYPAIIGWEGAGVVVGLGEGVQDVSVGDRVLHGGRVGQNTILLCRAGNPYATFKQYSITPADLITKIPDTLSFDSAAAVPVALTTAALGLYVHHAERGGAGLTPPWEADGARKYASQPIFILGGSSSVGQFVIQLARLASFSPIIVTASLSHEQYLKELGATHVIDRKLDAASIEAAIRQITTKPLDVVYDAVSFEDTQSLGYDVLAPGGTLVVVTHIQIAEDKRVADKRIADIFASPIIPDRRELSMNMYKHIPALFASGELKANRTEVVPNGLAGIQDGLERLGRKEVSAVKLIARPQETP